MKAWSENQADKYDHKVMATLDSLADLATNTQDYSEMRADLKRKKVRHHYIFYQIAKDGVIEVLRILRGRMNIPESLKE